MIFIYIVLYSHNDYIFQLNINTLDTKILYNLRGFTVQVTYICQNYLGFHTVVLKILLSAKTSSLACTCMHAHASLEK